MNNESFWDDFNGVPITDEHRSEWAQEITKYLIENRDEYYKYITSGDSIVFGVKFNEGPKEEDTSIQIYDCLIRRRGGIY